jgi:hypothetical protein
MPSSNGKTFTHLLRNTSMPDATILDVLANLLETEQTFIRSIRFFDSPRNELMQSHQRNTAAIINLLRAYMISRGTEATFTIPIRFPVPVGPSSWTDPVIVRPTAEQITEGTETGVSLHDENCAICQETITAQCTRLRHCGHIFHPNCISEWFTRSVFCPNCRHDIRETDPPEVQTPPTRQTGRRRRISSFISSIETDQDVGTITVDSTHNLPRVNSPLGGSPLEESRISHIEDTEESDEHHA